MTHDTQPNQTIPERELIQYSQETIHRILQTAYLLFGRAGLALICFGSGFSLCQTQFVIQIPITYNTSQNLIQNKTNDTNNNQFGLLYELRQNEQCLKQFSTDIHLFKLNDESCKSDMLTAVSFAISHYYDAAWLDDFLLQVVAMR